MGLLEKAQERVLSDKNTYTKQTEKEVEKESRATGLLEKAKQRKQTSTDDKKIIDDLLQKDDANKDIIEEKAGFGWKGIGTRRIVLNHNIDEYVYEILEPVLNEDEKEVKEDNYHRKERVFGKFHRSFTLPADYDPDKIKADFKDGVLKIEIPKPEEEKPKKIAVH